MPRHLATLLLAATLTTATPAAGFEPRDPRLEADWRHYQREVANDLIARDDARSLALGASLLSYEERLAHSVQLGDEPDAPRLPRESLVLFQRAFAVAGDDELVLAIILGAMPRDTALAREAAQRLRDIAPDNGAAWLTAFRAADESADEAETARRLAGLAAATRFGSYDKPRFAAWREAFARLPPTPETSVRMLAASEVDDAALLPDLSAFAITMLAAPLDYVGLTRACPGRDPALDPEQQITDHEATERAAPCRAAGKLLATRADTLIARSVGFQVWQAWAEDPDAVAAERRRLDWLMEASAQVGSAMFEAGEMAAYTRHMLEAWRDPDATEIDVMRDTLTDAGIALEPPADFVPAREAREREKAEEHHLELARQAYLHEVACRQAARDEARSLLVAAMLATPIVGTEDGADTTCKLADPDAMAWGALEQAGDDEMLLWVLAARWPGFDAALADAALDRLLVIAADNAAVQALALNRSKDPTAHEARLGALLQARRHETHMGELLRTLVAAYREVPAPREIEAGLEAMVHFEHEALVPLVEAMGIVLAQPVPELTALVRACEDESEGGLPVAACAEFGEALVLHSDNLSGRSVGYTVWKAAVASSPREAEVAARQRDFDWQWQQWTALQVPINADGAEGLRRTIEAWLEPGATEMSAMLRALDQAGIPLRPPEDFVSSRERIAREQQADADLPSEAH